jgi:glycine betaine/proline transport system permease protein
VVAAGRSFGASNRQILFDVQIPLALPTIMAGLNQTLMLSLSMVVIIALIAGGGLGQEILRSVGRLDIGRAVTSGLAVLVLAIVLDRISQASGQSRPAESE